MKAPPYLLFAFLVNLVIICEAQIPPPIYTIIAPSRLRPNSDYHVTISLHNIREHVDVDIVIMGQETDSGKLNTISKTVTMNSDETRILNFEVGEWSSGSYKMTVVGKGGIEFRNETSITFEPKSYSVFIQTDKGIYKPGQLVQFRAIVVNPNLLPSVTGAIDIHVNDARGNRIKQWNRELTVKGVIAKELQLSDQPVLGDWTIVVNVLNQKFEKSFTVAEYILPTYDVEVILPPYATYNNSDIICTVKATYTYGKPVKGDVILTVQPRVRYNMLTVRPLEQYQAKAAIDGSVDIPVSVVKDLNLKTDFFEREIEFFALVEESLTGRKYNRTSILKMFDKPVKIDLIKTSKTFKPGLPYNIILKVAYQDDIPVEDNGPPVKVRYGYSYNDDTWTLTHSAVPDKGIVSFEVIPPKTDSMVLGMRGEYRGQNYYLENIEAAQSPSSNFIQVTMASSNVSPKVGQEITVNTIATEPFGTIIYEVMGRGDIVLARSFNTDPTTTTHSFTFAITHSMAPKARVLVYYVRQENQEVVADALNFDVDGVFRTPVTLSTSTNETTPGSTVKVDVKTKPGALVSILGLDQSILLLKTGNDVTQQDVIKELETYDGGKTHDSGVWYRSRRSLWWPGSVSAGEVFQDSGVIIISNGLVHRNFPSIYYRNSPVLYAAVVPDSAGGASPPAAAFDRGRHPFLNDKKHKEVSKVKVRKYFPETWLWDSSLAGTDGVARFGASVPDVITSWIISAFAMDSLTGLGITATPSKITVFRPFFVQLALPYSVIRGEAVAITVVVFNYMNKGQNAEVILENSKTDFEFTIASDNDHYSNTVETVKSDLKRKYVFVPPQDGATVTFLVTPRALGYIDIKVSATTNIAGDTVIKKLLVKPEGQPQYFNKAVLVDLRDRASSTIKKNISVTIPPNAIIGSERVTVSVIGDILGPGINHLDDLLQMPYGCGEQNMLNFVPNIVVLEYLARANRLTPGVKEKALKHMEIGYQRELTYKRKDGSFSAFGHQDKHGSTWLTAFVLKSFFQARSHMDIDEKVIDEAMEWLMSRQQSDGSFDEPGEVHHKGLQGGSGRKGSPALTAYVLIALLHDRPTVKKKFASQIQRAEEYLIRELRSSQSTYDVAIITYALHLGESPAKDSAHQKLINFSKKNPDFTWWSQVEHQPVPTPKEGEKESFHFYLPKSLDVEATSYALLTNIMRSDIESSIPVLRWLISQQNEKGGFSSTQDTVIGLQALGQFASRVSTTTVSLSVYFTFGQDEKKAEKKNIKINSNNIMVLQRQHLPSSTRFVEIEATGFGSAIIQVSWQYNLAVSAEEPAFFLNPLLGQTSNENFMQLNICTYYKAGNSTNMAVMEVALPSGYTADVDSLPAVTRAKEVKRIDTSDGDTNVIIYMDRITRDELCLTVPAHRNYKVANHKPVPVTVYDYYNRQQSARMFYEPTLARTCDICEGDECGSSCNSLTSGGGKGREKEELQAAGSQASVLFLSQYLLWITTSLLCFRCVYPYLQ